MFAQKDIRISQCRVLGKNKNVVKMKLIEASGFSTEGIWFGDGEEFLQRIEEKQQWSVIYYPSINAYKGRERMEMVVQNIR